MENSPKLNRENPGRSPLRRAINAAYRRDEAVCVQALLAQWQPPDSSLAQIHGRARELVTTLRAKRAHALGVDTLLQEFSLSSREGVALMCLAEALLRIPDADTAERLIRDQIGKGDWKSHLGHSHSLFVNAATWGLLITGKLVGTSSEHGLGSALSKLIAKGGEPLIRKAALTETDAQRYSAAYENAMHAIGAEGRGRGIYDGPGISIKLSALHPRYARAQRGRVLEELLPRLQQLTLLARRYDIGVNIDAEEADRLDLSLDLFERLAHDPQFAGWNGLGFVVQAYQKRCPFVIDFLIELARATRHRFMLRLVKGAYWDSEIKRAQVDGLEGYPVYTRKHHTDLAYLVCAQKLLAATDAIYPQFATHNAHTVTAVMQLALDRGVDDYEFQCLHGMGESLYDEIVADPRFNKPCRIYSPVGSHETLLPYLVRRLLENGANSSFVNRLVDETLDIDALIADPAAALRRDGGTPHARIPLPVNLFDETRRNSTGLDLSNDDTLAALEQELTERARQSWEAAPILACERGPQGETRAVLNPAAHDDRVGTVTSATPEEVHAAIAAAQAFAPQWQRVPTTERAALLARAADALEHNRAALISLCVREAGKTWPNAIAEVREAVDYCRYYGQQMRTHFPGAPPAALGPVACISPWNFPLAIFLGQVTGALAAGNPVLAKPAAQTSLIAAFAVQLLHAAGIPRAALQYLPGAGRVVGNALIADTRVRGVIFTGSTDVAQHINRQLARRGDVEEIPLIAETGGQNVMIVDSSALPEQVVQDVLTSAFDSAGQRCSALRVLCLQRDIADKLLEMLKGAMHELSVGNPSLLATDIGPVIDVEAQQGLLAHVQTMRKAGRRVYHLPLQVECAHGAFVSPTLIEINSISELTREVFGPVLHVLRFERDHLEQVVRDINATGYGLTFGMHSRLDENIDFVTARMHVGNVYINRNMVGAVVGVQPFGGEGKSGTGPKAGGPLYLPRLLAAQWATPAVLGRNETSVLAEAGGALSALRDWAQRSHRQALHNTCVGYAAASLLGHRCTLTSATGEINQLSFARRGTLACLADTETELLRQIAAAVATGNDVVLERSALTTELLAQLPEAIQDHVRVSPDWRAEAVCAALIARDHNDVHGDDVHRHDAQRLRQELAARDGALIALVAPNVDGSYPLFRLVNERVVSVNTVAGGGNASLMTLGD